MRNTLILVLSCFCLSFACSSCHTADEELPRPEAPNPPVYTDGDGMLKFRTDMGNFLEFDSLGGQMLFTDSLAKEIVGINSMYDPPRKLVDMGTLVPDFGWVHSLKALPDRTWLLAEVRNQLPMRFWKVDSSTQEVRNVFTLRNQYQRLVPEWGYEYARDSHTIFISEYGSSSKDPVDPQYPDGTGPLSYKAGATKIWKSTDMGETWEELVDFRTFPDIYYARLHIHGIHYDQQRHRLYVTTGDHVMPGVGSDKRIFWTDDLKSWQWRDWSFYWGDTNDAYSHGQMVSLYAADDFILAGGDDYNNCIYRIPLTENPDDMCLEPVFYYNPNVTGLITNYTQRFLRLDNGLIVVLLTRGDGNAFPAQMRLVGTCDGYTWYVYFQGPIEDATEYFDKRNTLVYCNHRLYFSCQQKIGNSVFDVFYEMEEPKVGEGVRIPDPKAGESPTEGMDFTLSGRRVQPGQRGIIIHDSVKIPVQNDCLP